LSCRLVEYEGRQGENIRLLIGSEYDEEECKAPHRSNDRRRPTEGFVPVKQDHSEGRQSTQCRSSEEPGDLKQQDRPSSMRSYIAPLVARVKGGFYRVWSSEEPLPQVSCIFRLDNRLAGDDGRGEDSDIEGEDSRVAASCLRQSLIRNTDRIDAHRLLKGRARICGVCPWNRVCVVFERLRAQARPKHPASPESGRIYQHVRKWPRTSVGQT
jgi:hypothetical protein